MYGTYVSTTRCGVSPIMSDHSRTRILSGSFILRAGYFRYGLSDVEEPFVGFVLLEVWGYKEKETRASLVKTRGQVSFALPHAERILRSCVLRIIRRWTQAVSVAPQVLTHPIFRPSSPKDAWKSPLADIYPLMLVRKNSNREILGSLF